MGVIHKSLQIVKLLSFAKLMELFLVRSFRVGEASASRNQGD